MSGVEGKGTSGTEHKTNAVNSKNSYPGGKRRTSQNNRSNNDNTRNNTYSFTPSFDNSKKSTMNETNNTSHESTKDVNQKSATNLKQPNSQKSNIHNISSDLAILRHAAISHPQEQVTLTCYIPPSKVGAVIGRGGRSILGIQREASRRSFNHPSPVRMSVVGTSTTANNAPSNSSADSNAAKNCEKDDKKENSKQLNIAPLLDPHHIQTDSFWTPVIIRGDPCGAFAAANLLLPLIDYEMDDIVLDVPIHRSRHSAIIGRRGNTIASLSADCNVRIMVPSGKEREMRLSALNANTNPNNNAIPNDSGDLNIDRPLFKDEKDDQHSSEKNTIVEPPEAAAVRRRRENPSNIQLEGELQNVERCLIRLLSVVAPNALSVALANSNQVVTSINAQQLPTTDHGAVNTIPALSSKNGKQNSGLNQNKNSEQSNDEINPAINSGIHNNSKNSTSGNTTKRKNTEKVITAPPSSSHLLPSLTKLRQMGKKTGTTIRRKRINTAGIEMKEETPVESESSQGIHNDTDATTNMNSTNEKNNDAAVIQYETQFIITGRAESVERCVELFQNILTTNSNSNAKISNYEKNIEKRGPNSCKEESVGNAEKEKTLNPVVSSATMSISSSSHNRSERSGRGGRGRGRFGRGRGRGRGRGGRSNGQSGASAHHNSAYAVGSENIGNDNMSKPSNVASN